MGLGTFLSGAINDVGHVTGDVTGFAERDVLKPTIGAIEKVPVLGNVVHDTGRALTNMAQWDRDAYTWSVSRPVATLGLVGINSPGILDPFKGSTWSKSWAESAWTSPGQALAGNVDAIFTTNEAKEDQYLQGVFSNPNSVDTYFHHGAMTDRLLSGSYDAGLGWYSDPAVVAGHAGAGFRAAAHATQALPGFKGLAFGKGLAGKGATRGIEYASDVNDLLAHPVVKKMLDASDKMTAYQAKKLPFVQRMANPDLGASIFNQTVDRGIKEAALRYMVSDGQDAVSKQFLQETANKLATTEAAKGANAFKRASLSWGSDADQAAGILESVANAQQKLNPLVKLAHIEGMTSGTKNWDALSQALHGYMDDAEMKLNLPGTQNRMLQDILNMKGHVTWLPGTFDVPISAMRAAFKGADSFGDISKITQHIPGGATAPGQWVSQVLYKGLNQTPLKVLRAFGDMWPDGWLDYTNTHAGDTLEAFLNRAKGMDAPTRQSLINQFYEAGSDVGKREAVVQAAEAAAFRSTMLSHGFNEDDVDAIRNGTYSKRAFEMAQSSARANRPATQAFSAATYTAASAAKGAAPSAVDQIKVHLIDGEDGVPVYIPILETMKQQGLPLLDLDKWDDWAKRNSGRFQTLKNHLGSAESVVENSSELFNSVWKNGVLLRLGFTPRVMTDMGLRAVATLGTSRVLGLGKEAARVVNHNIAVSGTDLVNRLLKNRLFTPDTIKSINDKAGLIATAHDAARTNYANALMQKQFDDEMVKAGLPSLGGTPTAEQVEGYRQRYESLHESLQQAKADASIYQKTRFGDGARMYKGVSLTDIYGGENPAWLSQQMSSSRMIGKMFQRNAGMEEGLSGSGAWTTLRSDSQNAQEAASHPKAWRHAINNQIMGDTLASQVVRKGWNANDIQKWLKTPEGKSYLQNIPGNFHGDLKDYANRVAAHVHYTVPPEIRQEIIDKGLQGISQKAIDRLAPNVSDRPDVNGQLLNLNLGKTEGITNALQHAQHAMHKWLGTMPLDTFVYHPTAAGFYRAHLKDSIDKYISFNGLEDASSLKFDPALQQRMEKEAFAQAKNDVWSIMYDTTQQSTAAHQLRFLFPFLNAQQEILRHWFNIALDHPYIVQREQQIWNSPGQAGLVYDSTTGEKATADTPLDNQVIRFQIPHGIASLPGLGVLNDLGQMQISKGSINPILQGQNWYIPGAGPMVQVGVQALAKFNPGILDNRALKLIMPYGPGDNLSAAILPSFAQRLETGFGVNNAQYASTFAKVYQTETVRYNEGLRTSAPTMQEIQARTQQLLLMQALSSAVLPFSAKFNPGTQTGVQRPRAAVTSGLETSTAPDLSKVPIQGLIDQYKKLESVDPANAATNFYNQYGQALFALTMSTTKSNASVPATAAGLAAIQDPDIRAMIQTDPSVAYAIVGPQAAQGPFDMAAYNAEMNTQIGGGDTSTFRQTMDPVDMVKQQQAQQGWMQYDQLTSVLNAKMAERGLTSMNQSGAQDLRTLKDQFLYNMNNPTSQDYNPDWYEQYTGAKTDWSARIQSLTALVSDVNIVNNPARTDLKSLGQYLEARQEINQYLAARPNKEGLPTTLADKSNADLAAQWDAFVSQLVMSNTNFALIYQHLLAGDPVNSNLKSNAGFNQSLSQVVGQ
jgi:hypothetical protein